MWQYTPGILLIGLFASNRSWANRFTTILLEIDITAARKLLFWTYISPLNTERYSLNYFQTGAQCKARFWYKDHLYRYMDSIVVIRLSWDHLFSIMEILTLVRRLLYIKTGQRAMTGTSRWGTWVFSSCGRTVATTYVRIPALIHLSLIKMAAIFPDNIFKTIFFKANIYILFKFHWVLSLRIRLTLCQQCLRLWPGAEQARKHQS